MEETIKKPYKKKISRKVKHQNIGGKEILLEKILDIDTVDDLALKGNYACLNFIMRREDCTKSDFNKKCYYGHVRKGKEQYLGYVVCEDEFAKKSFFQKYKEKKEKKAWIKKEKSELLDRLGFEKDFNIEKRWHIETDVEIEGVIHIASTVYIGIDMNIDKSTGVKLLYETMLFTRNKETLSYEEGATDYTDRYATKKEAIRGHKEAVKFLKNLKKEKKKNGKN